LVQHLEILSVRATAKGHILLVGNVPHREAAAREQVIPDRRRLGVREWQRAEQVQRGGTDGQVFAIGVQQDIVADAELDIASGAIRRERR
jgi:hypothetical protein